MTPMAYHNKRVSYRVKLERRGSQLNHILCMYICVYVCVCVYVYVCGGVCMYVLCFLYIASICTYFVLAN